MLKDYRAWLESEVTLLGNASHHAYSLGQANMGQRAIERFDADVASTVYVPLDPALTTRVLTALGMLAQRETSLDPALAELRDALTEAMSALPVRE